MKDLKRFLLLEFPVMLKSLQPDAERQFGKMSQIEMLDHLRKAFALSYSGKKIKITTPAEQLEKAKAFLTSDKPIRPGAPKPKEYGLIPTMKKDLEDMKYHLVREMVAMLSHFDKHPNYSSVHPMFGELDIELWLRLHKKHIEHHMRQFGVS